MNSRQIADAWYTLDAAVRAINEEIRTATDKHGDLDIRRLDVDAIERHRDLLRNALDYFEEAVRSTAQRDRKHRSSKRRLPHSRGAKPR